MKYEIENILNLTIAEFWKKYSSKYINISNKNEMIIPIVGFFGQHYNELVREMFYYSEFRNIYMTNEGDVFKIYNPYGKDYDCEPNTEMAYVLIDIYKYIYKQYNTLISDICTSIYYTDEYVLSASCYPNEYEYFRNCPKCVMGMYEIGHYLDEQKRMHICEIVKTAED